MEQIRKFTLEFFRSLKCEVVLFLGSSNLSPKRKLNYNMESDVAD